MVFQDPFSSLDPKFTVEESDAIVAILTRVNERNAK